ncbi:expressed unknown protein [Seminavis robusta]|uniref:Uncharacterized protein n=1 Tax=Seminavis robusta TaxID=568900 RepID=A0A9N8EKK0_9STRA|nr:expressed unknown protein [Seminavis robusta]|eukprot:Sro1301_g260810.1 n/a (575) ;mRNA; f:16173-18079
MTSYQLERNHEHEVEEDTRFLNGSSHKDCNPKPRRARDGQKQLQKSTSATPAMREQYPSRGSSGGVDYLREPRYRKEKKIETQTDIGYRTQEGHYPTEKNQHREDKIKSYHCQDQRFSLLSSYQWNESRASLSCESTARDMSESFASCSLMESSRSLRVRELVESSEGHDRGDYLPRHDEDYNHYRDHNNSRRDHGYVSSRYYDDYAFTGDRRHHNPTRHHYHDGGYYRSTHYQQQQHVVEDQSIRYRNSESHWYSHAPQNNYGGRQWRETPPREPHHDWRRRGRQSEDHGHHYSDRRLQEDWPDDGLHLVDVPLWRRGPQLLQCPSQGPERNDLNVESEHTSSSRWSVKSVDSKRKLGVDVPPRRPGAYAVQYDPNRTDGSAKVKAFADAKSTLQQVEKELRSDRHSAQQQLQQAQKERRKRLEGASPEDTPLVLPTIPVHSDHGSQGSKRHLDVPPGPDDNIFIEIGAGVRARLRRTQETMDAIAQDYYVPAACYACTSDLFCIADVKYLVCPACHSISPLEEGENKRRQKESKGLYAPADGEVIRRRGVGLGFTYETLFQMQAELVAKQAR